MGCSSAVLFHLNYERLTLLLAENLMLHEMFAKKLLNDDKIKFHAMKF